MSYRHIGLCAAIENSSSRLIKLLYPFGFILDKWLKFEAFNAFHHHYSEQDSPQTFYEDVYHYSELKSIEHFDNSQEIPKTGPLVIVCNHPTGFCDIVMLSRLLFKHRPDLKILGNEELYHFPISKNHQIPINVFNNRKTLSAVKSCQSWLSQGGALLVFPAGEVSDYCRKSQSTTDTPWSTLPIRLAKKSQAPIVTFYIEAKNSRLFYCFSKVFRVSRLALIARELFNKRKHYIHLYRSNTLILPFDKQFSDAESANFLRSLSEALKYQDQYTHSNPTRALAPVTPVTDEPEVSVNMINEINRLSTDHVLFETHSLVVYASQANDIPLTLQYIQALREYVFSHEGMGTGLSVDADRWDQYYDHIFVWDRKQSQLVGACRFHALLPTAIGPSYIETLYSIDHAKLSQVGRFAELSRSIIAPKYQKNYRSLLYLWRGISQFILRRSDVTDLIGLVSIPQGAYPVTGLDLLDYYLQQHKGKNTVLSNSVTPKHTYIPTHSLPDALQTLISQCSSLSQLEIVLQQLTHTTAPLPVLFRQYESIGSVPYRLSIDQSFSGCVDILQIWNVNQPESALMNRLLGKEGRDAIKARVEAYDQTRTSDQVIS